METSAIESPDISLNLSKVEQDSCFSSFEEKGPPHNEGSKYVVDFDGPDDPENPLNWSQTRKWCLVGLISAMTLVTYAP